MRVDTKRRLMLAACEALEARRHLSVQIFIADSSAAEISGGQLPFQLARSGDLSSAMSVQYATADGTATAGVDYVAESGTASFAAGSATTTIDVQLIGDSLHEADETFFVNLTSQSTLPTFAATPFNTAAQPHTAALGDMNNDGRVDLISVNEGAASVSVLLNQTAPGADAPAFAAKQDFPVQSVPDWVTVGDLNNDGRNDLAITNALSDSVSVLLNTTSIGATTLSFAPRLDLAVGDHPRSLIAVDLNGDFKLDLVSANLNADSLTVYFNDTAPGAGAAAFVARQDVAAGDGPTALASADFNGDGKRDLAVAQVNANNAAVLLNNTNFGSATVAFAAPANFAVNAGPRGIITADINNDGRADLAVANSNAETGNTVSTLLNNTTAGGTTANFAAKQDTTVGTGPIAITAGDLNNDGRTDLAAANFASNTVSLLYNQTTAGGSSVSYVPGSASTAGQNPIFLATGDVNGDGKLDLAAANYGSNTAAILLNSPPPTIEDGQAVGTILDNDAVPQVNFQLALLSPAESAGTVNINVNLSTASGRETVVPFTISGTASTPGDYTISQSPLIIPAGATTASIAVTIVNDTMDEPSETVIMTLDTPTGATVGTTGVHTFTIADNDLAPTVRFDATVNSVGEGAGTFAPRVLLSAASGFQVTVPIQLGTGGTATSPADYTFTAGSVIIPAGQLSGTAVVLSVVDDQIVESAETVNLTLGTPTNATTTNPTSLEANIVDNDAAPAVNVSSFEHLSAPQRVLFQFSKNVSASLSVADLLVKNLNTESYIPAAAIALNYDTVTNTATFTFPGLTNGALPDGNYRARLSRLGITDSSGNRMQADGVVDFFALNGDANRDRAVNIGDFSVLAANFNLSGNYATGDFDYSGVVNISDFAILAARFNRTRAAPVAPARYTFVQAPNPQIFSGNFRTSKLDVADINDNGTIVGNWTWSIGSSSGISEYAWTVGNPQIGTGGLNIFPAAISSAGRVGYQNPFSFTNWGIGPGGALGNPDVPGSGNYYASDINDLGNIVGRDSTTGTSKAVRWLGGQGTYEVVLPQGSFNGINNLGEIVGSSLGNAIHLPAGSATPTIIANNGSASDINDNGKVLGNYNSSGSGLPFTWQSGASAFELEPLPNSNDAGAFSINNAGLIVGTTASQAVIWYEGLPYNLNGLVDGGSIGADRAVGINNFGQIAVTNSNSASGPVYVLTPIPGRGPAAPPIAPRSANNTGEIQGTIDAPLQQRQMASTVKAGSSPTFSNDLIERLSDVL